MLVTQGSLADLQGSPLQLLGLMILVQIPYKIYYHIIIIVCCLRLGVSDKPQLGW